MIVSSKIPNEVLREIFPKRLKRTLASEPVYAQLKKMILSAKLKRGERLSYAVIVKDFNVSRGIAHSVISQLKQDGLIICKGGKGSFVT